VVSIITLFLLSLPLFYANTLLFVFYSCIQNKWHDWAKLKNTGRKEFLNMLAFCQVLVTHDCNPGYSGGSFENSQYETGLLEHLPSKCEALFSNPSTAKKC
jgi:hypothetical protein